MLTIVLLTLLDGSQLPLKIPHSACLDFSSPYGSLKVPIREIRECRFGIHVEDEKAYEAAVRKLGGAYAERDEASRWLKDRRQSYKWLLPLKDSSNPEVQKRAEILLREYKEAMQMDDSVSTISGSFVGYCQQREIEGESGSLGRMKIKLSQIAAIQTRLQAQKFSLSTADGWKEVGEVFDAHRIRATGEVEMWPQVPGQQKASPDGVVTAPETVYQGYPAGALIGKIGERLFLVGSDFAPFSMPKGKLSLRINGSPWDGNPTGSYEITIE